MMDDINRTSGSPADFVQAQAECTDLRRSIARESPTVNRLQREYRRQLVVSESNAKAVGHEADLANSLLHQRSLLQEALSMQEAQAAARAEHAESEVASLRMRVAAAADKLRHQEACRARDEQQTRRAESRLQAQGRLMWELEAEAHALREGAGVSPAAVAHAAAAAAAAGTGARRESDLAHSLQQQVALLQEALAVQGAAADARMAQAEVTHQAAEVEIQRLEAAHTRAAASHEDASAQARRYMATAERHEAGLERAAQGREQKEARLAAAQEGYTLTLQQQQASFAEVISRERHHLAGVAPGVDAAQAARRARAAAAEALHPAHPPRTARRLKRARHAAGPRRPSPLSSTAAAHRCTSLHRPPRSRRRCGTCPSGIWPR